MLINKINIQMGLLPQWRLMASLCGPRPTLTKNTE